MIADLKYHFEKNQVLPICDISSACLAVEFSHPEHYVFPSGAWSTVDGFIQYAFSNYYKPIQDWTSHILVHAPVTRLEHKDNKITGVTCMIDGNQMTFKAKKYVLAAGTIDSAVLAHKSELQHPKIGKGITGNFLHH